MSKNEKLLDTIKKLLALGTSPVPAEANAAIAKANELMLRHNISMGDVEGRDLADYGESHMKYDFTIEAKYIMDVLKKFFFVEILLSPRHKKWMCIGTKDNVEIAIYMYSHIRAKFLEAWREFKKENGLDKIEGKTDFMLGVYRGLNDKLEDERTRLKEEEGLVWLGDPKVKEYMAKTHPFISKGDHAKQRLSGDSDARAAGYEAGQNMKLQHGITHGATKQQQLGGK